MKILQIHKLNTQQIKDVEALVEECLKTDGLERSIYLDNDINFYVNLDSFFLLYEENRLVSVLAIFEPLEEEAEITAYTLPSERKKGYFKALFEKAKSELLRFDLHLALFVTEPESQSGLAVLKALKAKYSKSEYLLAYQFLKTEDRYSGTSADENPDDIIVLKELTQDKIDEAAEISSFIFDTDMDETRDVIELSMHSGYMKCYGAYINSRLAGICNISFGTEQASIFGFGISTKLQGKGHGRRLLRQVMALIKARNFNTVALHVGSENSRAYNLYTSEGFQIQTQYDYYEYKIGQTI